MKERVTKPIRRTGPDTEPKVDLRDQALSMLKQVREYHGHFDPGFTLSLFTSNGGVRTEVEELGAKMPYWEALGYGSWTPKDNLMIKTGDVGVCELWSEWSKLEPVKIRARMDLGMAEVMEISWQRALIDRGPQFAFRVLAEKQGNLWVPRLALAAKLNDKSEETEGAFFVINDPLDQSRWASHLMYLEEEGGKNE